MGRLAISLRVARALPWLLFFTWIVVVTGAANGWWRAGPSWGFPFILSVIAGAAAYGWQRWRRERIIRESALPQYLKMKLRKAYPHLSQKDAELVERGLRQYFLACSRSKRQFVSMPSRVVDSMWHEFILHTQAYRHWCNTALGWFLHHTPAEALGGEPRRNDGLRRAWYWACKDEAINPRLPTRLPLLFALDTKLAIENGFKYVPDCHDINRKADGSVGFAYCGTDFGDGGAFGGDAGSFGGAESSDGSGADGGGDGGCGGGGCGGGGD
ncbi:glycine-rich domain-containing protein [Ramlibacter sp. PS4R-6]|uniref:glycine-rich domain-containing protein n=1 Tax=Ramlibacter sp. PS4R-6 TaxID=3133438 RepID=UPI0030B19BFA